MKLRNLLPLACGVAVVMTTTTASAQILFQDDFDVNSTANWSVNKSTGANANDAGSFANFFFDYSTVGVPSAPNSIGNTTLGLQLRANVTGGIFSGLSVSPSGESFTGNFTLTFDLWSNYQGGTGVNGIGAGGTEVAGGNGTTQIVGVGIGTAGTAAQWAGGVHDSLHFGVAGDGGAAQDYRVYPAAALALAESGYYAAGTDTTPINARNDSHPYYSSLGEKTAPAAQLALYPEQTGTTRAGAIGFAWREVEVTKAGNTVSWTIDGLLIATVDADPTSLNLGGDNILFNYYDPFAGSSTDPNAPELLFGLIDNVQVEVIPEPTVIALLSLGGLGLLLMRRRQQ